MGRLSKRVEAREWPSAEARTSRRLTLQYPISCFADCRRGARVEDVPSSVLVGCTSALKVGPLIERWLSPADYSRPCSVSIS